MPAALTDPFVAILVVLLLASTGALVFVNQLAILPRRKYYQPLFLSASILLILSLGSALSAAGLEPTGVTLLAALVAAFAWGITTKSLIDRRGVVHLSIVIPSQAQFNVELRSELMKALESIPVVVDDPFGKVGVEFEQLPEFIPAVQEAASKRPDYVILNAPSQSQLDSNEITESFDRITRRRGRIICLEMAPHNINSYRGYVTRIWSDTNAGARILAEHAIDIYEGNGPILLFLGPSYSAQASERGTVIESLIKAANINCAVERLPGWTREGCHQSTIQAMDRGQRPEIIICGNDTMALGATQAIREQLDTLDIRPKVFGYDGIEPALISIAQPESAFFATIQTPPGALGSMAGSIIRQELRGQAPSPRVTDRKIEIDGAHLISKRNPDSLIRGYG